MIGDNIKLLRETLGLTQQKFAERIGIKQNSVALIESNKRNISRQAMLSISREFKVRLEWLETGKGEMFAQRNISIIEQLSAEYNLTPQSRELIEDFLKLPPDVRDLVAQAVRQATKYYPRKADDELTKEEAMKIIGEEFDDKEEARKRGISTSAVSIGINGTLKKFGNGS